MVTCLKQLERRLVLIAYDTPDDKRRRKMVKILQDFGVRAQYSVFQAWLSGPELEQVDRELKQVIVPAKDSLLIVPLNATAQAQLLTRGLAQIEYLPTYWLV